MGIKDLHKFLKKKCGDVYVEKHLSHYAYKKIAIDISTYIYKYKNVFREHWLYAILKLITCLRKNKIHPIIIFDSKNPIEEKKEEFARRKKEKEKQQNNIALLKEAIKNYNKDKTYSDILDPFSKKSLLRPGVVKVDMKAAKAKLDRMEQNVIKITDKDIENFHKLLDLITIPFIVAEAEAEKLCAYLCIKGQVDAVLSEDTDTIAYGTPKFLHNLNTSSQFVTEVNFDNIKTSLDIEHDKFLDFCILCGTDYNGRIRGVGPIKAFELLSNKNLEDIESIDFDYKHIRSLFKEFNEFGDEVCEIKHSSIPDWNKLSEFLFKENIKYDITLLRNAIEPSVEFVDE